MNVKKVKDYVELSQAAADIVSVLIKEKPDAVLGLATGSTPIGTYQNLVSMYDKGELDFSRITTVNLDEYKGLEETHEQSYRYFMNKNLFDEVNIDKKKTFVPDGTLTDSKEACSQYETVLDAVGAQDLQLLGLGHDGHIGFNEPADYFPDKTHCVDLTEQTIEANKRFFAKVEDVPRQAYTMGIGSIMKSKKILVLVSGRDKAEILNAIVNGPVTSQVPGSILRFHPDCLIIADEDACALL